MQVQILVSELIRERRRLNEWTQLDLADRVGVVRNTIIRWENGENAPDPEKGHPRRLAQVLGGRPQDYEWTEADFEYSDRQEEIKRTLKRVERRLKDPDGWELEGVL